MSFLSRQGWQRYRQQQTEEAIDEKSVMSQQQSTSVLFSDQTQRQQRHSRISVVHKTCTIFVLALFSIICLREATDFPEWSIEIPTPPSWTTAHGKPPSSPQCVQVAPLHPVLTSPSLSEMDEFLRSETFLNQSVIRLAGAVQIKTETFDDMGLIEDDERWHIFFQMARYLQQQFPLVNQTLQLEKINTHGVLYTWPGTDSSLKPTVLMAHQDVVPVASSTRGQWTHDAFSGYYDGKYVWGRGSSDCKNTLVGILEAIENLIQAGFEPRRTLVLSFGFDEEISGLRGASSLAAHLIKRYASTGGAAVVLDEGATTYSQWGTLFAVPGVAEKGAIDVEVIVRMPGGHSSIPPPHTGIGVTSEIVSAIEAQPYEPRLYPDNPMLGLMQCAAAHSPEFPHKLKKLLPKHAISAAHKKDKLAKEAAKLGPAIKYLFTTSVAVDLIDGGVKSNALPERTRVLINHRVNVGETTSEVKARVAKIVSKIAQKHNLTLHAFSGEEETPSSITLRDTEYTLEPAPVTPTRVDLISPYSVLSGTSRALYGEDMIVSPGIMTGNTDTKYYWELSKHIFRYNPGWDVDSEDPMKYIHTVDEKISVVNHVRTVRWYTMFVRNMDEAEFG